MRGFIIIKPPGVDEQYSVDGDQRGYRAVHNQKRQGPSVSGAFSMNRTATTVPLT